jgi:phosphatidate cytidylyltransferase
MNNLQKRILTSLLILPLSLFFVFKGSYFLLFFLIFIFFAGLHEVFSNFKKIESILFLSIILILSLFSIHFLRAGEDESILLLYFTIALCISSDIGGYVFGKIFKWKKFTKVSPNKTISGIFGSFFLSFICWVVFNDILITKTQFSISSLTPLPEILLVIIFTTIAQIGDLTISYIKRLERIKDTGKILPGHGGIFDRIDGLMFVVIFTFILNLYNI